MLAEFLAGQGKWEQVMPGVRVCQFSLKGRPFSLSPRQVPLHFEVLFCLSGAVTLTWQDDTMLTVSARQVMILDNHSNIISIQMDVLVEGILVEVDARRVRENLKTICGLLGDVTLDMDWVWKWMNNRGKCVVEGPTDWSRAVFANLSRLPQSENARWCVWKSVELLYFLGNPREQQSEDTVPALDRKVAQALEETCRYMDEHLDEPLTIPVLSRQACLSATTFKEGFRRLYGMPVHTWLRQRRMEHAAELLRNSSLSVLGVAQSVGYGSASQFTAAFRRQYGMAPAMYRKMSESA